MKKTALLIDGGWFSKSLGAQLSPKMAWASADQVWRNATAILAKGEEIFRIFYYDCEPFGQAITNPVDKTVVDYAALPTFAARRQFLSELGQKDYIALRYGELMFRGWQVTDKFEKAVIKGTAMPLSAANVRPAFQQKGVDMRIGIDVASLALKRLVDRIVLFSADTDMTPAIKLARREGVQVFLVKLGNTGLPRVLVENADAVRSLKPTA